MVKGDNSFLRYDLVITRGTHEENKATGVYPEADSWNELTIREEDCPNFSDLKKILDTVGKPYGWDRRLEYNKRASVLDISAVLARPESRRFSFWATGRSGPVEVGGAIIANVEENVDRIVGKAESRSHLGMKPKDAKNWMEIYKIGLFPEYTNKGWGKQFLPQVFEAMFDGPTHPAYVYLNTRSTNHGGVIKFYRDLNMHVIHAEGFPNDLIDEGQALSSAQIADISRAFENSQRPEPAMAPSASNDTAPARGTPNRGNRAGGLKAAIA